MTHAAFSRAPDYKMEAGMHRSFFRPSPALIVACIALMIALGGTGYAALALPANSVGPKQLKANAVTSGKVKDGSLLALDFKRGQLPAGPAGAAGSAGPAGAKGDKGDPGLSAPEITHIDIPIPAHASVGGTVECPAGKRMTGGGGSALGSPVACT